MHKKFLRAALIEAKKGLGFCSPNPAVGAVVVHDGKIVSRAFHQGAGLPHAEILTLDKIASLDNLTLYVTLEPCNHWGKTPPCVDAIIKSKIKRVVYAFNDPNPIVQKNNTPNILKAHGIEVIHFRLPEIDNFYKYYSHWVKTGLPWVTIKLAQSLDGKIAAHNGTPVHFSNEKCNKFTHIQRMQSDAILTSMRTIYFDDPKFTARVKNRVIEKPLAIINSSTYFAGDAKVFNQQHRHVIYTQQANLPEGNFDVELVSSNKDGLNLSEVIQSLGKRGFHRVWVEVGASLFKAFHQNKLVDETYVYITPHILPNGVQAYPLAGIFNDAKAINWRSMDNNVILYLAWK